MTSAVQFFIDNQPFGSPVEGPVPRQDDEVELDSKRYRVRQVVIAYWLSGNGNSVANVYVDPEDYDITKSFR
ncbi:MAG: hypothetical protein QOK10_667 [Pseudonocardiales bacterium]|jgi:hypothetical protein|nr:hypothetical protein [Pseudonocardiales bacterium]